jgi:phosphopantetheine adenylyltransferase
LKVENNIGAAHVIAGVVTMPNIMMLGNRKQKTSLQIKERKRKRGQKDLQILLVTTLEQQQMTHQHHLQVQPSLDTAISQWLNVSSDQHRLKHDGGKQS